MKHQANILSGTVAACLLVACLAHAANAQSEPVGNGSANIDRLTPGAPLSVSDDNDHSSLQGKVRRADVIYSLLAAAQQAEIQVDPNQIGYQTLGDSVSAMVPVADLQNIKLNRAPIIGMHFISSGHGASFDDSGSQMPDGFYVVKAAVNPETLAGRIQFAPLNSSRPSVTNRLEVDALGVGGFPSLSVKEECSIETVDCPPNCKSILFGTDCIICFQIKYKVILGSLSNG